MLIVCRIGVILKELKNLDFVINIINIIDELEILVINKER